MSDCFKSRNRFGLSGNINNNFYFVILFFLLYFILNMAYINNNNITFLYYKCTFDSSLSYDAEAHFCKLSKSITFLKNCSDLSFMFTNIYIYICFIKHWSSIAAHI